MTISELISQLESIREKQGDCEVWVDVPERGDFLIKFEIVDKWYSMGYHKDNVCYIVLPEEG